MTTADKGCQVLSMGPRGGVFSRKMIRMQGNTEVAGENAQSGAPMSVLLIDDDRELCRMLAEYLAPEGFKISAVHDGDEGLYLLGRHHFDLIVLDVMLPRLSGLDVLRQLRQKLTTPVLMLTARGEEVDRVVGLELGADDYLPKPFNPRELVARMRAILRRKSGSAGPDIMLIGDIEVECGKRKVVRDGSEIALTGAEFDILFLLVRSAGKVLSREEIAEVALGRPLGFFDRSIDNHVSSLRKKLGSRAGDVERIQNVRGAGYVYAGEIPENRR